MKRTSTDASDARAARLAEALRANLRRRKAQKRARAGVTVGVTVFGASGDRPELEGSPEAPLKTPPKTPQGTDAQ